MTKSLTLPIPTSVPHLMARAFGLDCEGPHKCFYCGSRAMRRFLPPRT